LPTFILIWNPDAWSWEDNGYFEQIEATERGEQVENDWSVGVRRKGIASGDRALVMRQRRERGLVAAGTFTGPIYSKERWDGSGRHTPYAKLKFDRVLDPGDRLPVEVLKQEVPEVSWDRLQGSGIQVPDAAEPVLARLWADHLAGIGWHSPEEDRIDMFSEGTLARVEVNKYERDPRVRNVCIAHWGCYCSVCDFDFEAVYGEHGRGFIHVHHLLPLGEARGEHGVDPVNDLRPVCPNCHAMLHRGTRTMSIELLRSRLTKTSG
jgi:5-methylcytosine-specific restriction protein A